MANLYQHNLVFSDFFVVGDYAPNCPKLTNRCVGTQCCCAETLLPEHQIQRLPRLRVLDPKHRLGPHISLKNNIMDTLTQPGLGRCRCVQFFLGSPRTKVTRTIHQPEKEQVCAYCDRYNLSFYVHCPYIANLAKSEGTVKEITDTTNVISSQLGSLAGLPAACVLHIGKVGTLSNVATRINHLPNLQRGYHARAPRQLLLENAAGQGTELGKTWDELRLLFEAIDTNKVGLCLDTQHLFASGMCDFVGHESIVRMFDAAEAVCPGGLQLIHLNDSDRTFGSRVDRHASLLQGHIWGGNDPATGERSDESLRSLMERCHEKGIDTVLETPSQGFDLMLLKENYGC